MAFNPLQIRQRRLEAARGYLILEMPEQAIAELDAISDSNEVIFEAHQLRGEALRQAECYADALEAFEQAWSANPTDLSVALGMAWCYKRTGQLASAIATMKTIYESHPNEPIVLYNLSCYLALAGDKEHALSWLGRALRMGPALRKLISEETDFDSLRNDADFQFVAEGRTKSREQSDHE